MQQVRSDAYLQVAKVLSRRMAVHADMHGYRHGRGIPIQEEGASIG